MFLAQDILSNLQCLVDFDDGSCEVALDLQSLSQFYVLVSNDQICMRRGPLLGLGSRFGRILDRLFVDFLVGQVLLMLLALAVTSFSFFALASIFPGTLRSTSRC